MITCPAYSTEYIRLAKLQPDATLPFGQICPNSGTILPPYLTEPAYQWQIGTDSVTFRNLAVYKRCGSMRTWAEVKRRQQNTAG